MIKYAISILLLVVVLLGIFEIAQWQVVKELMAKKLYVRNIQCILLSLVLIIIIKYERK